MCMCGRGVRVSSRIKSLGGRGFTQAAKCLATPTFVDHTTYYMLVHHSRSSYILHIIDSTNVMTSLSYKHFWGEDEHLGGKVHPSPPPLDKTLGVCVLHVTIE